VRWILGVAFHDRVVLVLPCPVSRRGQTQMPAHAIEHGGNVRQQLLEIQHEEALAAPWIRREGHRLRLIWRNRCSLSPCGRGLGRGVICARSRSFAAFPSSGAVRHLLPQGEKGITYCTFWT